ncbi:MAG: hypothetical protein KA230_13660 [Flavobacteriales bacterium]|nr:hypothetical protein [Flavobacteriales bacterium]MBK9196733.1 hypothetical protein [Flavobacteriales bacterium]MBP6575493.1 hypothetical protein [Flavobacteriales bacterium]
MTRTILHLSATLAACMLLCQRAPAQSSGALPLKSDTLMAPAMIDLLHMPSPYRYTDLGFFCKAEVKLNRWLPMPVMFRLGDVQQAQELDGKGMLRPVH